MITPYNGQVRLLADRFRLEGWLERSPSSTYDDQPYNKTRVRNSDKGMGGEGGSWKVGGEDYEWLMFIKLIIHVHM